MKEKTNTAFPSIARTLLAVVTHPRLLLRGLYCVGVILTKFFFFQYFAALSRRIIPVTKVDHSLDDLIPFTPGFVPIYLDFIPFWIRVVGFLSVYREKQGGIKMAGDFIASITSLYTYAFQLYRRNLSTTKRPRYTKTARFKLIHLFDPHLMCIPSLHVMIVIHTYTAFRHYMQKLGEEETLKDMAKEIYCGAVAITEAILYIKQHSINCVAASLYTMRCFNPVLFDVKDAETFLNDLFKLDPATLPPAYIPSYKGPFVFAGDILKFRKHIMSLYLSFMNAKTGHWTIPLLDFLALLPKTN
jgi:hypothetical protein